VEGMKKNEKYTARERERDGNIENKKRNKTKGINMKN
jgi:hypothetical protein